MSTGRSYHKSGKRFRPRRSWGQVKPWDQPHGGKHGAKGYDRNEMRRQDRKLGEE